MQFGIFLIQNWNSDLEHLLRAKSTFFFGTNHKLLSKLWKIKETVTKWSFWLFSFTFKMHLYETLFTINIGPTFYFLVYFSKLGVKYQKDNLWYTCPHIKYHILLTSISKKRKCGLAFISNQKYSFY